MPREVPNWWDQKLRRRLGRRESLFVRLTVAPAGSLEPSLLRSPFLELETSCTMSLQALRLKREIKLFSGAPDPLK